MSIIIGPLGLRLLSPSAPPGFRRPESIARSMIAKTSKASALSGIAQTLAATDPDRAEDIARSFTDEDQKASALREVAEALTATSSA